MKKLLALPSLLIALMIPSCGFASITVSSPTSGATVESPVKVVASAHSHEAITGMVVYVDSQDVYSTKASSINTSIPMSAGTHSVVVKAWNSEGKIYADSLTLKVASATTTPTPTPLKVTSSSLTAGTVGTGYSATLQATGGTSPYKWTLASGTLPAGLTLSTAGAVSGTPTASGSSSFSVKVTDSASTPQTATASLALTIGGGATTNPTPAPLKLTTSALANGTVGTAYSASLQASGGTSPYTWSVVSGTLPAGLTLSTSGTISGTPTASGTSSFSLSVKDSASSQQAATSSFTLTVAAASVSAPPPTTGSGPTYYVSTTGSDSNAGTSTSSAWKTVTHACSAVSAGATVVVLPGTYSENPDCEPSASGTAAKPITITAQYPATLNSSNHSIFTNTTGGDSATTTVFNVALNSQQYIHIIGFEIGPAVNASGGIWNNGSNNLIQSNLIHDIGTSVACNDNGGAGIVNHNYSNGTGNLVNANVVYNVGEMNDCNYFHGIYISDSSDTVTNNIVSHVQSVAITTYHGAYNTIIVNNTVVDWGNSSYGNAIDINHESGEGKGSNNDYVFIANNLVYGGAHGNGFTAEPDGYGTHDYIVYNDSYDNPTDYNYGSVNGADNLSVNPDFVAYAGVYTAPASNYGVTSSSPLVGAGISNAAAAAYNAGVSGILPGSVPSTDFFGNTRATNPTIGAIEYK